MKIENLKIAKIYANTLYKEAEKQKSIAKILKDLETLNKLISNDDQIQLFFISPIIKSSDKILAWKKVESKLKINSLTNDFINLLFEKRREKLILEIIQQWFELYYIKNNILNVNITSTYELSVADKKKISDKIKKATKSNEVILNLKIDKKIIGGLIIEFNNKILDASIKNQLFEIQKKLIAS